MFKNRVIVYVDGFNLYFGMVESSIENCKWLNIKSLIDCSRSCKRFTNYWKEKNQRPSISTERYKKRWLYFN